MQNLLRLKHWQLFALLFGIPAVAQFVMFGLMVLTKSVTTSLLVVVIVTVIFMCLYFGWLYAMGTNLHKKLPGSAPMNVLKFKIFVIVPLVYVLLIYIYLFGLFNNTAVEGKQTNDSILGLIIPVHLFAMYCIFYCLYFIARVLKAVELQKPVTFSDFSGEFLLIWFLPIGIWIIQPRINKLFNNNIEAGVDSTA